MTDTNATQAALYDAFILKTKPLRDVLEAKIKAAQADLEEFRKPFDAEFDNATLEAKLLVTAEVMDIERVHRYACHNATLKSKIHKMLDRLEKKRLKALKPIQQKWDDLTSKERAILDKAVSEKVKTFNAYVKVLQLEFDAMNKADHEAYMAAAAALELGEIDARPMESVE